MDLISVPLAGYLGGRGRAHAKVFCLKFSLGGTDAIHKRRLA